MQHSYETPTFIQLGHSLLLKIPLGSRTMAGPRERESLTFPSCSSLVKNSAGPCPEGQRHLHLLKEIGSMPRLSQAVGVGEAGFGGPLPWA